MPFLLLYSCKEERAVERINQNPVILSEGLFTSLPGEIVVLEDYLVWLDHTSLEGFVHIVERKTGKEVKSFGKIGEGPDEFITPRITKCLTNSFILSDLNYAKQFLIIIGSDNFSEDISPSFRDYEIKPENNFIYLAPNTYVSITPEASVPFNLLSESHKSGFGKFPVTNEKITNGINVFQGIVQYNPNNNYLLYSIGAMSYVALYENKNNQFNLKWEKTLSEVSWDIKEEGKLVINETPKYAPTAIALTKNYIISIERDKERTAASTPRKYNGRDFSRVPTTLFVYDYNLSLIKIIDTGLPIIRISSDGKSDELFFICLDTEFAIGKLSVQ
ncbi:BF3164 family lipoprotein [Bacteroides sp. 214]|uniref:BF3164 family lipoprotein n=1 Tax=Bacteroides sp. 214 TaxID=2302935 RepID=UPI0019402816|nr:BF3164 family lipoprotein [Bacteroides sp. 214]